MRYKHTKARVDAIMNEEKCDAYYVNKSKLKYKSLNLNIFLKRQTQNAWWWTIEHVSYLYCFRGARWYSRRITAIIYALTIARSSSNSRQPMPSNLSKSMRPFHRTHTPFIMKCDSMWTCVGKDKSIEVSHKYIVWALQYVIGN